MIEDNKKIKFDQTEAKAEIRTFKKVSNFSVFIYKKFKLIILLEVLLILLIGYLFIIRVELSEIGEYHELISWKQEELKQMKNYKDDSLKLEKRYNIMEKEVEKDLDELYNILPPKEDLPNIMAQLEALVNSHGFILGSIEMSSKKEAISSKKDLPLIISEDNADSRLIEEVEISVFVFSDDGGYERIKELLDAFERHIRFIDVISFGFENNMESYSIALKTYYLNYEE
jgi:Tfp pilus assembly protein PilO